MDRIKLLVLGDSGVGKSSLVSAVVSGSALYNPSSTIGCNVEVMPFKYSPHGAGSHQQRDVFLEFWEIGGSAAHKNSRSIFYAGANGIILVHDLLNRKSYLNLKLWLREAVFGSQQESGGISIRVDKEKSQVESDSGYDVNSTNIPIAIIGTKEDQNSGEKYHRNERTLGLPEGFDITFCQCSCVDTARFLSSASKWQEFEFFLNKVIENRFYPGGRSLTQESENWRSRKKVNVVSF